MAEGGTGEGGVGGEAEAQEGGPLRRVTVG